MSRTARRSARPSGLLGGVPIAVVLVVLVVLLVLAVLVAVGLGPVGVPPEVVVRVLLAHARGAAEPLRPEDVIVWQLRAPRVLTGTVTGAGLAVSGLLVQAMVRNPVGDPYILGLSSGASAGAVLVLTTAGGAATGLLTTPAAAFAGAAATGFLVLALARSRGRLVPTRMVLAGVAVGQLLGGVTSFLLLRTQDPEVQQQVLFWLLGSLAGARWDLLAVSATVVGALIVPTWAWGHRVNLLVIGDDDAAGLGLDPARTRAVLFAAVGLMTGTVVAVSGSIGFVGLVVPNLARMLLGADHRRLVPACALLGALLVVVADTAARLVLSPTELPIGILTAAVGVPFFLAVLRRSPSGSVGA